MHESSRRMSIKHLSGSLMHSLLIQKHLTGFPFSVDVYFNLKDVSRSEPLQHKYNFFVSWFAKQRIAYFEYQRQFMKISDKGLSQQQKN